MPQGGIPISERTVRDHAAGTPDGGSAPAPLRILLVEDRVPDSLLVREALNDAVNLHALNLDITSAATLGDALIATAVRTPACILVDLALRDSEGTEAVRALRAAAPSAPIIVLTSVDDELTGLKAIEAGAQDYLVKGQVAGAGLGRIIRYAVERERMSRSASGSTAASESMFRRRRRRIGLTAVVAAMLSAVGLAAELSQSEHAVTVLEGGLAAALVALGVSLTLCWTLAATRFRRPSAPADVAEYSIRLPERTIETWTEGAAELYGYEAAEVIGRDIGMLAPDHLREESDQAYAAVSAGQPVALETECMHRDGRAVQVSLALSPIFDKLGRVTGGRGVVGPGTGAASALARAEGLSRGAFEHASAGMGIVSLDPASYGRVLKVNPALCTLTGCSEASLLRMNVMTMVDLGGADSDASAVAALLDGRRETYEAEKKLTRDDGQLLWVEVGASLIRDDAGRPLYGMGQVQDVTERKLAEEAQAHLGAIVDFSTDAIVAIDTSRRVTAWSSGATAVFGHASSAVIGRDFDMLIPPRLRDQERLFVDRAIAGQPSDAHHALMQTLDGSVIEVSLAMSPIYGEAGGTLGASAIARDIKRDRAGAAALHASERRLRQIVETANEGIWTLDERWQTTFVNQKMADLLGTTAEAMLGTSVFDYYDDAERPRAEELLDIREDGACDQFETRLLRADGGEVWVVMSASGLFDGDGRLTGALAMVADITERRAAERELGQWQRLEGLGQLAGGVAHDMNNLLGVILNFSDFGLGLVEDGPGSDELREIRQAAERAATLTRQLLVFARQDTVHPEPFDLNALLDGIEKLLRRTIGENIELTREGVAVLPPVNANPGLVEQVVLNLVVNARDAMPDGGGVILTTDLLEVGRHERGRYGDLAAGQYVCLSVADEGEGMTPAVAARAFDPFFTTKPTGSGTGLGLATVYGAVTKAGGRVQLDSEPGRGTEVKVWLPVAPAGEEPSAADVEWPLAPSAHGTVLVVEDDSGVRKVTVRILEGHGYRVLAAAGAAEGLELARIHREDLGLVITDVVMPGMSGVQMAERLAETDPGLPVMFVSGYTAPGELPPGCLFLGKPFDRDQLLHEAANARREAAPAGGTRPKVGRGRRDR